MEHGFIFHDPTGRRWVRFQRGLQIAGLVTCAVLVLLGLSLVSSPHLPALGLPAVAHLADFSEVPGIIRGQRTERNVPYKFDRSANPVIHPKTAAKLRAGQPLVFGYYVNWDPASMVSLRLNLSHLTHLVPEWFTLSNAKGDLTDDSDLTVIRIAADAHLPILALVTNFRGGWQSGDLHNVLNNAGARENLIDNIASNLAEHKFAGVNIDFEQLQRRDRERLVEFMKELRAKLAPGGYVLTESAPTGDPAYDLKQLASVCDYIVPMLYDEHYQSGSPGPVASEEWFENELDKLGGVVPPEKTVIGFGNYGYDWVIGSRGGTEVTFSQAISAAEASHSGVVWDRDTENPALRFTVNGQQHELWFLDSVTALNQAEAVRDGGFRGMALWRLGSEDPGLWKVLHHGHWPDDPFQPARLFTLTALKAVNEYGDGEILRVVETPHDGKRNVWRNKDDDFEETYDQYPAYYVLESSGTGRRQDKTVAVTFDDGPDPDYTPRILDILRARNVPAAFFVVGVNAERAPGLIRRIFAEGHLIGNHTYTHPNIAAISPERARLELNTTQRLIEHDTGRSTTLFRPPYNADSEPQTPEEIEPLLRAQNLNYVTVGERIDPRDWEKGATADAIVAEVMAEKDNGHVLLLHDGGGDRSQTVAALPRIIDGLRAKGYRFVALGEIMGKTRDQLMPPPGPDEARLARLEGEALITKGNFKKVIGTLFLMAICLMLVRWFVFGSLALLQKLKIRERRFRRGFEPPVSVIIAAYNEEKVIARTVRSILDNGYPGIEVIVVDDGSKDRTSDVVREQFGSDARVRLFVQTNRGKATALNYAISRAQNPILVALDADTIFRRGTIGYLTRHFSDPRVGAVSGNARVGNRGNWLTRFQSIEYICGFNLDRRALDLLNAITVVPGAAGAWRKDLVEQAGGFPGDTLAEDTDLTLAIRRLGYQIRYEEKAIAYTEAPETGSALARQRFRWAFGTLQAVWKHREATFHPKYGALGYIALPSIWIFQVLLAILSPFAEIAMIVALFAGNWVTVLLYYFGFFLLDLLMASFAYGLEWEKPYDLALFFFQRVYYRLLMHFVLAKSLLYAIRGRLVGWGKLERTASVEAALS